MSLSQLKKRLSQLNAKLRLFIKWEVSLSKKYRVTIQIIKLEEKIEKLEQSQALPNKKKIQSPKEDFSKKPNAKIFKAFLDKFENSNIIIPKFSEDDETPPKIWVKFKSGEISIINYQILPNNYYFNYLGKKKNPETSSQLHALYAAIGQTLANR